MGSKRKPTEPLPEVAAFIRSVQSGLTVGATLDVGGLWFSRHDEGSLFLDAAEAAAYSRLVADLLKQHVPREDLSARSVESFLQEAIFSALDLPSRSSSGFNVRLRVALELLLALLKAPPERFRCWIPIEGLELNQPSARFGGVTFGKFGHSQIRRLTSARPKPQGRGVVWRRTVKRLRESSTWGMFALWWTSSLATRLPPRR